MLRVHFSPHCFVHIKETVINYSSSFIIPTYRVNVFVSHKRGILLDGFTFIVANFYIKIICTNTSMLMFRIIFNVNSKFVQIQLLAAWVNYISLMKNHT